MKILLIVIFVLAVCSYKYWTESQLSSLDKVANLTSLTGRVFAEKFKSRNELLKDGYLTKDLTIAAKNGDLNSIKVALNSGVAINAPDYSIGMTMLHHAASKGQLSVVKFLVEQGANINAQDNDKSTPFHFAAYQPGNTETLKFLLSQSGYDLNLVDKEGLTVLGYAKLSQDQEMVEILKKHGAL